MGLRRPVDAGFYSVSGCAKNWRYNRLKLNKSAREHNANEIKRDYRGANGEVRIPVDTKVE
jgi:hypothetical protein